MDLEVQQQVVEPHKVVELEEQLEHQGHQELRGLHGTGGGTGRIHIPSSIQNAQNTKYGLRRKIGRYMHANRVASKAYYKRKLQNAHPIRTMGKVAGGAALGALAAGAGMGIAMATGDSNNVIKMAGGFGIAGATMGSRMMDGIGSGRMDSAVRDVYNQAHDGGQYRQDAANDYVKNYMKDVRNQTYIEEELGKSRAKQMQQNGELADYLQNKVTDKKEIVAAEKLIGSQVNNRQEAIAIARLAKMIGHDTTKMSQKTREEWEKRLETMATKSGASNPQQFAKDRMDQIDEYYKNLD